MDTFDVNISASRPSEYEVDPYAAIRQALSPAHAALPAHELVAVIGRQPMLVTLHRMLASPEPAQAALAVLLGRAGRRHLPLNGSTIPVSAYLRMLGRLCHEAAQQSEADAGSALSGPVLEWDVPPATQASVVVDPFPTSALSLSLDTSNTKMNSMMAAVAADPAVSGLCAALVDLTGDPATPSYAGFNDNDMIFVGSLDKICAAYAAFELRQRVRDQVLVAVSAGLSTAKSGWETSIIKALEADWKAKLAFHGLPAGFPNLATIFSFSANGDVDFASASPPLTNQQLGEVGTHGRIDVAAHGRPAGKFFDWLRSMLRHSNNFSASLCIRALSFPYINGALAGAGFFDSTHQNGLWLSADYADHDWIPNPPAQPQANRAGRALTARWQQIQGRKLSNAPATAFQVARLMTLLAQDKLFTEVTSNQQFRDPLIRPGGTVSFISDALRDDGRTVSSIMSKIGIGDDDSGHDCAVVERVVKGKTLRYVVVGLGDLEPTNAGLRRLFPRLDDIIMALH
ncbi:MAG: serine hydrolase [Alphaproteobacteria bacterium]|nr:serine hydrolase [Alphaproteobacteria bacterium]